VRFCAASVVLPPYGRPWEHNRRPCTPKQHDAAQGLPTFSLIWFQITLHRVQQAQQAGAASGQASIQAPAASRRHPPMSAKKPLHCNT
jgi:hypothetical protein